MSLIRGITGALETFQALLHLHRNSVFREIRSCSEICKIPPPFFPGGSAFNNMQLMQGGVLQPIPFCNVQSSNSKVPAFPCIGFSAVLYRRTLGLVAMPIWSSYSFLTNYSRNVTPLEDMQIKQELRPNAYFNVILKCIQIP